MSQDTCAIFLNGFCPKKQRCDKSHDVKNCTLGPNCTNNNCNLRHPPFCINFLRGQCGFHLNGQFIAFSKCAFFHPAKDIEPTFPPTLPPLLPIPRPALQPPTLPPQPHPRIPLVPESTWYGNKIQDLENQIHKLSERLTISNKPDLGPPIVHPPPKAPTYHHTLLPPYHLPPGLPHDLEAEEGARNINRDIKEFLDNAVVWSDQLEQLFQHSKQQGQLVTDMVGTLKREMEELRTKVNKLEKEIANKINTVTKEEMENKFAGIAKEVGRVATLEKAVSKLEKEVAKKNNDSSANDTKSIIKKITEIEENLQKLFHEALNSKKLGKHLYCILQQSIENFVYDGIHSLNFNRYKSEINNKSISLKQKLEAREYMIHNSYL